MKRTIVTLVAILALAVAGALVAQSSNTGTAPAGTALNDPGQQSNNLNKPENVNPSPANSNGMTTGTQPYTQPTGTTPTTTPAEQTAPNSSAPSSTLGTTSTETTSATTESTSTTDTGSAGTSKLHRGHLPRTASELPLFAALGLLALSAGFVVRSRRDA